MSIRQELEEVFFFIIVIIFLIFTFSVTLYIRGDFVTFFGISDTSPLNVYKKAPSFREGISISYALPIIPVTFRVSNNGELSVVANGTIRTPIGSFSVEWEKKNIYYLEVTLGSHTRFYKLGN